ncbi:MAG: ASKHA domain-containing protein [Desulfuromonadales bacterium]
MPVVTFESENRSIEVQNGITILEASRRAGVLIEAPCNGAGHCCKCLVRLPVDDLANLVVHMDAPHEGGGDGTVLACHAEIYGDVAVEVLRIREEGLRVVSAGSAAKVTADPYIEKHYDVAADQTKITAGDQVLSIEAGDTRTTLIGLVVDIGTTTLVAALVDLNSGQALVNSSSLNPQSLHAQDVLSRIRFAASPDGLKVLQRDVIAEINRLIDELTEISGIGQSDIHEAVLSGNTCMLHLLAGVDPAPLGKHPFLPTVRGGDHLPAAEIGLNISSTGLVYLPPVISAYVGADISSGILATDLAALSGTTLFIDIGTNGELVLANNGRLIASATAAGPAFEGMNISFGMRAAVGAIERADISSSGTLDIGVIGGADPTGICGSGLMDLVAELLEHGLIGRSGRLSVSKASKAAEELSARITRIDGGSAFHIHNHVLLSQKDIRQVQLAKGAIRAGIELLLQEAGVLAADLDRVLIAGSFGYHLRERSLLTLGLLPPEAAGKVSFVGNTSRSGAEMLLLNQHTRNRLKKLVEDVDVVDLAGNPHFERVFIQAMGF